MDPTEDGSHEKMASIKFDTARREDGMSMPQDTKTACLDIFEVVMLILSIGLVWILLLLPIIFYHLPDEVFTKKVS